MGPASRPTTLEQLVVARAPSATGGPSASLCGDETAGDPRSVGGLQLDQLQDQVSCSLDCPHSTLALVVAAIIFGATGLGIWIGRSLARRGTGLKEPLGVVQASLVGFVALLLAFGLTMAVGRYEARRGAVVLEANAIGTTYLRAQTLAEPMRTKSLELLKRYADARIALSDIGPGLGEVSRPRRRRRSRSRTSCGRLPVTR